jgi:hypothetical protein
MNDDTNQRAREWQPLDTVPYGREVEVKLGSRAIRAQRVRNASMTEDEVPCDQWQATTDRFPKCWSDGCCWATNADGVMSEQPEGWREVRG